MSETPETDEEIEDARNTALDFECRDFPKNNDPPPHVVPADFARRLERERDEARREAEKLREKLIDWAEYQSEKPFVGLFPWEKESETNT